MRRISDPAHPDRGPRQWVTMVLGGVVLVTVLLVATMTTGQAGGLFDWLLPGKGSQQAEALRSPASAELATVRLRVEGMVCYGWVSNVKGALERLDGVVNAEVNLEEKAVTVQYDPNKVTPAQMLAAIHRIGFRVSLQESPSSQRFQGQGTVVAVDPQRGTVTLDHGEITGLMPPMVMEFTVDFQETLQGLNLGDTLLFTLRPRGLTVTIADMTVLKK